MKNVKNMFKTATAVSLSLLTAFSLVAWSGVPAIAQDKATWLKVGTGDCPGRDIGLTNGFTPDDKYAKADYTAVCWDGSRFTNAGFPGKSACTYKNISPDQCTGGSNLGIMYRGQ